ncbi:Calponiny domain containing protein [Cryptosporidium felis]|nr:Calponiny domain containing protein [Cryptosporidium felis]
MQVFEIFIIRYINYINIWSVELTNENFYEEFRDGILLVSLLKKWSNLYGYNTDGDLVIYKRPLNKVQALSNINLCLNFIRNPPEKSNLPELINNKKELITAEDIYEMREKATIGFINSIFHHYLIPYLRINSKRIIDNVNKYLQIHGLSLSEETVGSFYKMLPNNLSQFKNDFIERVESWEQYLSLNITEMGKKENENKESKEIKFHAKFINPLQCDITSNGFLLLMIMMYQMGWIDTAILSQMYYFPKTLEEYRWNHEIVYYAFQTILKYLNLQKELILISNEKEFEDGNKSDIDLENDESETLSSCEIPFILAPLSSLYIENFSPYILLLQIDVIFNLLSQQIDSNYDLSSLSTNRLPVYGPYQPISLDLLDEITYKDNYPLNWTVSLFENDSKGSDRSFYVNNTLTRMERLISESNSIENNNNEDEYLENEEFIDEDNIAEEDDNSLVRKAILREDEQVENSDEYTEIEDGKLQDEEFEGSKLILKNENKSRIKRSHDAKKVYFNLNENKKNRTPVADKSVAGTMNSLNEDGIDEMFTGLEKELEILKIYESKMGEGTINKNNIEIPEDLRNNVDLVTQSEDIDFQNCRQVGISNYSDRSISSDRLSGVFKNEMTGVKFKPYVSRTALEEQQRIIFERSKNEDEQEYTSKVFEITRKQNGGVIEKISNAISENKKLLEKLKRSMDIKVNSNISVDPSQCNQQDKNLNIESPEKKDITGQSSNFGVNIASNKTDFKENTKSTINTSTLCETKDKDDSKSQKKVTTGGIRRKKGNKVSFSDRVQMEVERTSRNGTRI